MKPTLIKFSINLYGCQIYSYIAGQRIAFSVERRVRKEENRIQKQKINMNNPYSFSF
jgi:hypothetical protein